MLWRRQRVGVSWGGESLPWVGRSGKASIRGQDLREMREMHLPYVNTGVGAGKTIPDRGSPARAEIPSGVCAGDSQRRLGVEQ